MTKAELRILYLLRKNSGVALRSELTAQMHRIPAKTRDAAFLSLERQEFIMSLTAKPGLVQGGREQTRYWFTSPGLSAVEHMIKTGVLRDPLPPARSTGC